MERCCFGPTIEDRDLDQQILGRFLGILNEYVEVAVIIEYPRIEQFVLEIVAVPLPACTRPASS